MYLAWAVFYEGFTDAAYFDILLPKILDEVLAEKGTRPVQVPALPTVYLGRRGRQVGTVAEEICREREAFHLLFLHADTGGRAMEENMTTRREAFAEAAEQLCGWRVDRTALLSPRHETEAWALADGEAVCRALGFLGAPEELGLPPTAAAAEQIIDPKKKLNDVARSVSERAYRGGATKLLPLIAQEQSINTLRGCSSFLQFEQSLERCLISLGCLHST